MTVEQISVFVQNKAGQLDEVARVLEEAGINIRALSLADTADFGVLRLMADDTARAGQVLREAGFTVGSTPVVAVEVADSPGGLGHVLALLSQEHINVEYLYAYTQRDSAKATLIFRFDRNAEAVNILRKNGVRVLSAEEIAS